MDSLLFLHIQNQSTTITYLFPRLSKVKILPNAVIHTKEATLKGALTLQILFQGKGKLTRMDKHDNMISRQTFTFWKGSNIYYPHLLALI
jgi:hypothetical protein